jgi:lipoprotein-anchoring transpeptidase ErfK/SrfK
MSGFKIEDGIADYEQVVTYTLDIRHERLNWFRAWVWRVLLGAKTTKWVSWEPKDRMIVRDPGYDHPNHRTFYVEDDPDQHVGIR